MSGWQMFGRQTSLRFEWMDGMKRNKSLRRSLLNARLWRLLKGQGGQGQWRVAYQATSSDPLDQTHTLDPNLKAPQSQFDKAIWLLVNDDITVTYWQGFVQQHA